MLLLTLGIYSQGWMILAGLILIKKNNNCASVFVYMCIYFKIMQRWLPTIINWGNLHMTVLNLNCFGTGYMFCKHTFICSWPAHSFINVVKNYVRTILRKFIIVTGPEIKTDRNDGIAGHAGREDGDCVLRKRLRQHHFRKFLLYEEGDCTAVDRSPYESGL